MNVYKIIFIIIGLTAKVSLAYANELSQLNLTLNSLANQTINLNKKFGLIGKSLIGKKFKDIFDDNQLPSILPITGHDKILVDYDLSKGTYQLRSSLIPFDYRSHVTLNSLWMIHGIEHSDQLFKSYQKTLSRNVFENYLNHSPSTYSYKATVDKQLDYIKQNHVKCLKNNECLPEQSINYLNQIFIFYFDAAIQPKKEQALREVEPDLNSKELKMSIECYLKINSKIVNLYSLLKKENACFAVDICSGSSDLMTDRCLIVNKYNDKAEYILMAGISTDNIAGNLDQINLIDSLVKDPENLKKLIIRETYLRAWFYLKELSYTDFKTLNESLSIFYDNEYAELNLLDNELYQKYKPYFCTLINDRMKIDMHNAIQYEEFLKKMKC